VHDAHAGTASPYGAGWAIHVLNENLGGSSAVKETRRFGSPYVGRKFTSQFAQARQKGDILAAKVEAGLARVLPGATQFS